MSNLVELQNWFQQLVVATDEDFAGPAEEIDRLVKGSQALDAESRVWLYRNMYPMRMIEAMQVDFPGVRSAVGPERFEWLVMEYVKEHPSRSWTLNRLGDHFPGFIRDAAHRLWHGNTFLVELATLELSLCKVFDAAPQLSLTGQALRRLTQDAGFGLRLKPVAATALHSFSYPVSTFLAENEDVDYARRPRLKRERVLVYRKAYDMGRMVVSESAYAILRLLWRGSTLGAALNSIAKRFPDVGPDTVQEWFRLWSELGLFALPDAELSGHIEPPLTIL